MALVTSHQQPAALVVALDRLGLPNTEAVRSGLALSVCFAAVRSPWPVPPRWRACPCRASWRSFPR